MEKEIMQMLLQMLAGEHSPARQSMQQELEKVKKFITMPQDQRKRELLKMCGIEPTPFKVEKVKDSDVEINLYKGKGIVGVMREVKGIGDIADIESIKAIHGLDDQHLTMYFTRHEMLSRLCKLISTEKDPARRKELATLLDGLFVIMNCFVYPEDVKKYRNDRQQQQKH